MKKINIGVVNLILSNKLKESYFNDNMIEESKSLTTDFLNIVKNSPILQLEFKVFNNIENKHIENELIATRYIDNNIKLFEIYTLDEINEEREKLNNLISEINISVDNDKMLLYNAIDDLIQESINDYNKIDVDKIHESFTLVLNHVKENKKQFIENVDVQEINEEVIEIAVNKFNEKYEMLSEDDKELLRLLIKSDLPKKQEIFESYKTENLIILERFTKDEVKENIKKAIEKIKEMKFNPQTIDNDIIGLHELKRGIL